jgi:GPH family glycoside/pentoside/hexuronide:cation symporter
MPYRNFLLYGAGQLGVMLVARYFFQWLVRFCDVGKGTATGALLSAGLVGVLFLGFRVFDAVTDPLAGAFGDTWVRQGKERRNLLWFSFALPALGLALIFAPTLEMPVPFRYGLLAAGMLVFFVGYTLYAIPYWALCQDYAAGDAKVRTGLSNMLGLGVLLATGLAFGLSPFLVQGLGFLPGALIFGCLGTVLMALPYFAAPKAVPGSTAHLAEHVPLRAMLASSLKDRRFVALILLYVGSQMSFTMMTSAAPYVSERLLGDSLSGVAKLLGPFLLASLVSFAFVPRFARWLGWERATLAATLALGVAYAGAGLLGQGVIGSPMTTAMIVFAAAGPGAAVVLGLEGEAIARCAQEGEHKATAVYFGVFNFFVKAMNGVALSLTGFMADIGTKGAVRAMPITAGVLCAFGVVAYFVVRRQPASPERAAP